MAECLQVLEDNLTCSICFEVFSDPVTLPCNHSYCRECLQVFADKSKEKPGSASKDSGAEIVLSCPQCRVVTDLGMGGVAGLPIDIDLLETLVKLPSATRLKETPPLCSVCEEDNKTEAVKFCTSCSLLYCDECLSALHPTRGVLKEHVIIPVEEHLCTIRAKSSMIERVERTPSCDIHTQPYTIYCVTCHTVICTGCLADHTEHTMSDIKAACEKLKAPLLKKTEKCEGIQFELNESLAGLKALDKDIQRHEGLQKTEIVKAYNRALEALNTWKNNALQELEKRHSDWHRQCGAVLKDLEMKLEEIEREMITSRDISSSTDVACLQNVNELGISIDNQLSEIRQSLKVQRDVKMKLQSALELDAVFPRTLAVTETPQDQDTYSLLKFTKTSDKRLKISENSYLINGNYLRKLEWYSAWTDGRFQSGHITWGMQITVLPPSTAHACSCMLGVVREGCAMYSMPGKTSWWIEMRYVDNKIRCVRPDNCQGDVTSGYDKLILHRGPQRLGFSLNCNERTLTVTDIDHNQIIATVREVDLSQPVIPAVGFCMDRGLYIWGLDAGSVSARIIPWHCST